MIKITDSVKIRGLSTKIAIKTKNNDEIDNILKTIEKLDHCYIIKEGSKIETDDKFYCLKYVNLIHQDIAFILQNELEQLKIFPKSISVKIGKIKETFKEEIGNTIIQKSKQLF